MKVRKKKPTYKSVAIDLIELGESQSKVYKAVKKEKVKGIIGDPASCPIANLLKKKYHGDIQVGEKTIDCGKIQVITPIPILAFIEEFDLGFYPDLEEEEE